MKQLSSLLTAIGILFGTMACSQSTLEEIISSARDYHSTVEQAENYFVSKHGDNYSAKDLCEGMLRDGEYVKFRRWQAYWKDQLNPDGSLGDPTAYFRSAEALERAGGPFDDIEWTNLSYENYIDMQIGLGRTTSLGFHPTDVNTFFVGAAIGGVWKTTDGGETYTPLGDELPFLAVSSIVVNADNPDEIYIAMSDHLWYGPPSIGVYKSIDGGATWNATALSFEFQDNIRIYWMIADPSDADRVFVCTDGGLYLTTDGFETVEELMAIDSRDLKFNAGDPSIVYMGANNGNFYRSTDGGLNFDLIDDLGSGALWIAVTPLDEDKVFVRSVNVLRKSFDGGENFIGQLDQVPDAGSILAFSPQNEDELLSGWFDVWRSTDDGNNFDQITHWLNNDGLPDIHVDQRNVFTNPLDDEHIYLTNDGGVYKYNVVSQSFTNLCEGLMITQFYDIAVSQSDPDIIGGGSQDNGNVFRNTEGVWEEYAPTGDGMNQDIDPFNEGTRYWEYQLGGMQRYVSGNNQGIAPPGQNGNGAWETPFKLDYSFPDRMICAFERVYESWNQGNTWEDISGALDGNGDMEQLAIAPSNPNRIYVARSNKIWVKDVLSNDWEEKSLPSGGLSDLEVDHVNMDLIYITVAGFTEGSKVYRSSDAGDNWENISGSIPNVSTGAIEPYKMVSGGLFVGTDAGVYYRDDTYDDWQLYGTIPHTRVEDVEIQYSAQLIRIGTHGRGVLEAPVTIGICDGTDDADDDGICDEYDICAGFDDTLLGTPCNDGNGDTVDDAWIDCDVCEGILDVSVDEQLVSSIQAYPNPAVDFVWLVDRHSEGAYYSLVNTTGQQVRSERIQRMQKIDMQGMASGVYLLRVFNDSGMLISNLKVQKL